MSNEPEITYLWCNLCGHQITDQMLQHLRDEHALIMGLMDMKLKQRRSEGM